MKEQLIQEVQRQMLPYLNNAQLKQLQGVLEGVLSGVELSHSAGMVESAKVDTVACFINAKRIEGCSEKTLSYYRQTIVSMLAGIEKEPQEIVTEDLRKYLTVYQMSRKSSKVTIDNIRRILSSYFSWLEDEDYIVKSPVRRIHKVKTAKVIKETYTDEALEIMRDNCCNVRDLAMIDLLASSGMRVGDADGKISLNQQKPSKHAGLRRFGPEKFLQRNNEFMKERPIFYKKPIKTEKDFSTWLRCFYYTTKAVITEYIYF